LRYRKYLTPSPGTVTCQITAAKRTRQSMEREVAARADRNRMDRSFGAQTSSLSSFARSVRRSFLWEYPSSSSALMWVSFLPLFNSLLCSSRRLHILILISRTRFWSIPPCCRFSQPKVWSILDNSETGGSRTRSGCISFIIAQICARITPPDHREDCGLS
jgi:hypothetical protein